jgi:hypothetical protein
MRPYKHRLFQFCILLFLMNQALEQVGILIEPLYSYLDDILCLPISLTLILIAEQFYFKDQFFVLPWQYTLISIITFSFLFEGILPVLSGRYTADALDIAAYTLGGFIFHFGINNSVKYIEN